MAQTRSKRASSAGTGVAEARPSRPGRRGAPTPEAAPVRPTDADLAARSREGDREAFSELVSRHQDRVVRVCFRQVGRWDDALDIAQEAFVKAYRAIGRFRGESKFSTWLYRIAVNAALTHRRRRRRDPISLDAAADHEEGGGSFEIACERSEAPCDEAIRREDVRRVRAAIDELPERHRVVIVLRDIEGMAYEEISDVLGCKLGSVKSRIHRARSALADSLRSA